jgi:hypothetical protein
VKKENEERLAALKAEHGQVAYLELPGGRLIAFKKPTLEAWEDYQEARQKQTTGLAQRQLCLATRLLPQEAAELNEIFKEYPALNARISDAVIEMAGVDMNLTVKKD